MLDCTVKWSIICIGDLKYNYCGEGHDNPTKEDDDGIPPIDNKEKVCLVMMVFNEL